MVLYLLLFLDTSALIEHILDIIFFINRRFKISAGARRGMEHARCPACLQHPNETHGVAQPCPRGFAPVLTGAIWAAAAELLPAVRQLADRYNAQGTRRRFTGKERRRRCRRFTAARSRLSKLATPSMRTSRRSWTRETSPPLSYRGTVRAGGGPPAPCRQC